jgi:hypothetical protein
MAENEYKPGDGVASAALWAFIVLLSSVMAAAVSGYLATPKDIPARAGTTTTV